MKRIALALIATAFATTAFASSDRPNDLRLDTSKNTAVAQDVASAPQAAPVTVSTKGKKTPYAYLNPYGVGPNNDSR